VRSLYGQRDWNVPSRFLAEIPQELTDADETPSAAQAASTWGTGTQASGPQKQPEATFAIGDDVVHARFGEGVVTGLDAGGVVVVRFQEDGSEKRLMADYAPLKRR